MMNGCRFSIVFALLAGLARPVSADLDIHDAWVRAMPPGATGTAGYLRLDNVGASTIVVVGASSEISDSAQLHQSVERDGLLGMTPLPRLSLVPGAEVVLEPGGRHLMLMGLKGPLKEGAMIELCLTLESGGEKCTQAEVRRGTGSSHHHH